MITIKIFSIFKPLRKQTLQSEFDEQLLRLTELQKQYNFKCDEVEVRHFLLHGAVVFA